MAENSAASAGNRAVKGGRVLYFDILRILATFFVIVLHVAAQNWYGDIHTFEWKVFNVYDSISRWGVPIFVMISGALFLSRDFTLKELYSKYILRLAVAFLVWSVFYSFIGNILGHKGFGRFVAEIFEGHYHMWFLYMIIGLYMIVPFLKRIVASEALTKYYLLLGVVFAFFVPQLQSIASLVCPEVGEVLDKVVDQWHFHFVLGLSTYFVLGYTLNRISIGPKAEAALILCGIAGFASTILLTLYASNRAAEPDAVFYSNNTLNVFAETLMVFTLVKKAMRNKTIGKQARRVIRAMSKRCFGVYLAHAIVIATLNKVLGLNTLSFNPVLSVPVISILVFAISYAVSAVIHLIPGLNRYIV